MDQVLRSSTLKQLQTMLKVPRMSGKATKVVPSGGIVQLLWKESMLLDLILHLSLKLELETALNDI